MNLKPSLQDKKVKMKHNNLFSKTTQKNLKVKKAQKKVLKILVVKVQQKKKKKQKKKQKKEKTRKRKLMMRLKMKMRKKLMMKLKLIMNLEQIMMKIQNMTGLYMLNGLRNGQKKKRNGKSNMIIGILKKWLNKMSGLLIGHKRLMMQKFTREMFPQQKKQTQLNLFNKTSKSQCLNEEFEYIKIP